MRHLKILLLITICINCAYVQAGYEYQLIEKDKHKIHVIILDPKEYKSSLLVAHDQVFGREVIADIAKRVDADVAINAGFFEIGSNNDGMPSGTLISDGQIYGMIASEHACLVKREDSFFIEKIKPNFEIIIGENNININKINKFAQGKNIFYFNNNWGVNTLSKYIDRAEIIIDQNLKITEIIKHGGNKIPPFGHVLSLPISADLSKFHVGQQLKFKWTPEYLFRANNFAIMGMPVLIKDNIINSKLSNSKDINARTAVGIRKDGKIVLVVAEHHYVKPILEINLGDIKNIFTQKKVIYSNLTVLEIKNIVLDNINSESKINGLTMMQLAKLMQEYGCIDAINLDGGGSSSMYVDGKYINESYGDKDEAKGQKIVRPVSDAIVFYKRNK